MNSSISNSRRFTFIAFGGGIVLLVIMLVVLELFLRSQVSSDANSQEYRVRFLHGEAPWTAFGDSHVEGALLSGDWLDNLGQASDNLNTIIAKVSLRVERGGVQGVIIPADPQLFSFYRVSAEQEDRIKVLNKDYSESLMLFDPRYRPYLGRTLWSVLSNPSLLWSSNSEPENTQVQSAEPTRPRDWLKSVTIRVQLHTPVANFSKTDDAKAYRQLITGLRAQGIDVCMVRYPVSKDYLTVSRSIAAFSEVEKFFADVAASNEVLLVDVSSLLPGEIFIDPDHIPASQREYVTNVVKERCAVNQLN
ncbi:hypothetical protein [Thalassospira povalilytica]|nr:hypothetical protein [Thalassospira povalilytica]